MSVDFWRRQVIQETLIRDTSPDWAKQREVSATSCLYCDALRLQYQPFLLIQYAFPAVTG